MKALDRNFYQRDTREVAKDLIGKILWRRTKEGITCGYIVEAEAYKQDEASHANKKTGRSKPMFGPKGKAYIYLIYGMHFCFNVVAGDGPGAVLIRAIEPKKGIELMKERRETEDLEKLTNGPGKVCEALSISKDANGRDLDSKEIKILDSQREVKIQRSRRIGINKAEHLQWRFFDEESDFVSRK